MSQTRTTTYAMFSTPRAAGVESKSTESADPPQQEGAHMDAKAAQRAVRRDPEAPLPVLDLDSAADAPGMSVLHPTPA